ncbi:hypothetical protein OE766_28830 [Pararhizobium sp. YC-54]|uniref:hypothetical protein n=1 Tax=Pararhizobium sp. YC-54 TaxID=2986920 RepID=UPI0021F7D1A7|nr:hypothetical protein [Pararhizobium sp. YC-54]MCW0002204.1 hypothetical protein [Pararhizobium sp. YC-54]
MLNDRMCKTAALIFAATLPAFAQEKAPVTNDLASCAELQRKAIGIGLDDEPSKKKLDLCMFQFWRQLGTPVPFLVYQPPSLDLPDQVKAPDRGET